MKSKELKKALITTTALGLAINSFFSNNSDVEITYKEKSNVRDYEDFSSKEKTNTSKKEDKKITREDVAKVIFSIGSIIALIFKTITSFIFKLFKGASAHSLLISTILDAISIFIIIFTLFIVLFKLIYPEKSLKELLTFKNITLTFIASIILSIILNNLDLFNNQKIIMTIIESIASSFILFGVYAYVLRSDSKLLIGPKALIKTKKGRKTIHIVFVSIVIGCIVKILLVKFNILVPITNLVLIIILTIGLAIIVVTLRKKKLVNYSIEFPENVFD